MGGQTAPQGRPAGVTGREAQSSRKPSTSARGGTFSGSRLAESPEGLATLAPQVTQLPGKGLGAVLRANRAPPPLPFRGPWLGDLPT